MTDDSVTEYGPEMAALRALAYQLADVDPDTYPLPDAAKAAVQRMTKLEDRIAQLEAVVDTDLDRLEYEQLTRRDKVLLIQRHLVDQADGTTAAMTNKDVWYLFNRSPSRHHCYELMEIAGEDLGFNYENFGDSRDNRLTVRVSDVNKETLAFVHGNKDSASEGVE